MNQTDGGSTVEYDDFGGTYKYLSKLISRWKTGEDLTTNGDIEKFTNENQTKMIAGYLDEIIKESK